MPRVSLEQKVVELVEAALEEVNTGFPGIVQSYDRTTRLATVVPAVKARRRDEADKVVDEALPPIVNVPVHFPGSRLWSFVWDVKPGEDCWLKFSKYSLEDWLSQGAPPATGSQVVGASDARLFHLSDAVAEMVKPPGSRGQPCPADRMRLGADDGPLIEFDLANLVLTVGSINEVRVLGKALVRIESAGDVFVQKRRVNPLGGEI
jgi:hypothetical protein